jgi:hypothetical protein
VAPVAVGAAEALRESATGEGVAAADAVARAEVEGAALPEALPVPAAEAEGAEAVAHALPALVAEAQADGATEAEPVAACAKVKVAEKERE